MFGIVRVCRCCEFRILVGDWSAAVGAATAAAAAMSIDVVDFIALSLYRTDFNFQLNLNLSWMNYSRTAVYCVIYLFYETRVSFVFLKTQMG